MKKSWLLESKINVLKKIEWMKTFAPDSVWNNRFWMNEKFILKLFVEPKERNKKMLIIVCRYA